MARTQWHWQEEADTLTLARHWPPRLDVCGRANLALPAMPFSRHRLAQQIRQDLWRRLRRLRGFSPVVALTGHGANLEVCAGGRASHPIPAGTCKQIEDLLTDPHLIQRWIHWAKQGKRL